MKAFLSAVSAAALAFTVACSQSDAGITTAVKSKLAADDTVKAYQVNVDTQNKVVTLSGDVETAAQREHAVVIARNTKGVTDVIDNLRVNATAATSGVTVDEIESKAKEGADAVSDAAKKGAEETKEGAKKAGSAVKDVFTDKDRDSDKDGK
jgi:hyperosmotically inducible protein